MGVPTFFRWIHDRFPRCISDYIEHAPSEADPSSPNPNGIEFDNLYLDFNGIVHTATHPSDRPPPATTADAMLEIFAMVDRLMLAARPRKLLYVALDGVAPRAKMDQQRSRRFMAARERENEIRAQAKAIAGGAPLAERNKALKKLRIQWHPDKNTDDPEAAKQVFQFIEEAKGWFLDGAE